MRRSKVLMKLFKVYIYGIVSAKRHIIKIVYKNAFCLNRCNFRTVKAIDFLFSILHSTPFLYVDLYFRVLHELRADVMRPDYPWVRNCHIFR